MLAAVLDGRHRAIEREQRARAWSAWMTAALTRAAKMPKLDRLLGAPKPRQQTWEEQFAIAKTWTSALTGKGT